MRKILWLHLGELDPNVNPARIEYETNSKIEFVDNCKEFFEKIMDDQYNVVVIRLDFNIEECMGETKGYVRPPDPETLGGLSVIRKIKHIIENYDIRKGFILHNLTPINESPPQIAINVNNGILLFLQTIRDNNLPAKVIHVPTNKEVIIERFKRIFEELESQTMPGQPNRDISDLSLEWM